jgi:hypothetical protein
MQVVQSYYCLIYFSVHRSHLHMNPDLAFISHRLDSLEQKLDRVLSALAGTEEEQWITTAVACKLMSISDKHLMRLIASGVIHGPAIRNVGTAKSPRYRYHRQKLINQWLKRPDTAAPKSGLSN